MTTLVGERSSVIEQALDRFRLAAEASQQQRDRELEDLKFQVPELQWPEDARNQRAGGTIANVPLPARPMLSISKLDQPIQLVLNQEKAAHLGVQIHPLSEDADEETATMLQDHYRQIEVDSRAGLARSWAFERGVKCGWGCYRLLTEYDPYAPPETRDQRIVIKRILHQQSVYLDPFSEEPNFSDARYGFITQWVPWSDYKRKYGAKAKDDEAALAGFDDALLNALAVECPGWVKGEGPGRAILLAEYFTIEEDAKGKKSVHWRKINAVETLEEADLPGTMLPIFVYIGKELIPFDTDRRFTGIITPNKDGQRFFNYAASTAAETMGQEPKSTWVMAEGQEEGHEQEFLLANVRNFPYLRYKPTTLNGELVPPPTRVQADTTKLGLSIQALGMASEFVHAGTFTPDAALGNASPNTRTKGGTLALQQQSEAANSNWLAALADTMTHEASVVLDWIAYYYDRPGRIVRTMDTENNHDRVMLNQPYVKQGGKLLPVDRNALPQGVSPDDVKHYDVQSGKYAVSVSIGKAYKSRLEQGADMLGQLLQAEPGLMKVAGDIYFNYADFPGAKELSKRFKKMLPPELRDEDGEGDPKMELQQAKAMLQQMQQQMQEMAKAIETDRVKVEGQVAVQKHKDETTLLKTQMDNETKLAVAELGAKVDRLSLFLEERARLGVQGFDAQQAEADRRHDVGMAVMAHDQALREGQAGVMGDAALADQAANHASAAAAQQATFAPESPEPTE